MEEGDLRDDTASEIAEPSGPDYVVKNRVRSEDAAIHNWYRFVLGYPPHLVREYLKALNADPLVDWVLDPFCGTGTTPVEARLQGFPVVGTDANPLSFLATRVKLAWDVELSSVPATLQEVMVLASACLRQVRLGSVPEGDRQLSLFGSWVDQDAGGHVEHDFDPSSLLRPETASLIPRGFISEKPLLRVLALRYAIERLIPSGNLRDLFALALASTIVGTAGNVAFGPEIYSLPPRDDADVLGVFSSTVGRMVADLQEILARQSQPIPPGMAFQDDARILSCLDQVPPIGIVITSPPLSERERLYPEYAPGDRPSRSCQDPAGPALPQGIAPPQQHSECLRHG